MEPIVFVDGEYRPKSQAVVNVFDHGLLYGDGCFEGIRWYNRRIFKLEEHLRRLYDSARVLMITIPMTQAQMAEAVIETCRRNNLDDGYIRLVVTRGVGDLGISPLTCKRASVIIIANTISLYPKEVYETGSPIITASVRRTPVDSLNGRVKSLNYLNNIMAKLEAIHAGVIEAIMLDHQGHIVECTVDNFFTVRDGVLTTPPAHVGALRGVTRDTVLDLARSLGIETREDHLTLYEAYTADEVFLTGSGAEVIPVTAIDRRPIGDGKPGATTKRLMAAYKELVRSAGTPF